MPNKDAADYDGLAVRMLTAKSYVNSSGLPTAYRAPLYPLFLALVYSLFGHDYFYVRLIQAALYAFLCIIVYLIAEGLFDRRIGLLSALICIFYKPFIFFSYYGGPVFLLSEHLSIFLLAVSVLCLVKFYRQPALKNAFFAGATLGLATLNRTVTSLLPFFLLPWVIIGMKSGLSRKIKIWLVICFSFLMLILPWTARNYLVMHKFVFLTTQTGKIFFSGNNPFASGGWGRGILSSAEYNYGRFEAKDEVELDKIYMKEGLRHLFENPKRIPLLFIKKVLVFWHFKGEGVLNWSYLFLLPFAVSGIFASFKEFGWPGPLLLLSIFAYFSFIAMVFFGDPRFRYPLEPYVIIFASIGILSLCSKFLSRRTRALNTI